MLRKLALFSTAVLAAQIQCAQPQGLEDVVQPNYASRHCHYDNNAKQLLDEVKKLVSKGDFADEEKGKYYAFRVKPESQSVITAAYIYNGLSFPDSQLERIVYFRNGKTVVMENNAAQSLHSPDEKFSCIFEDNGILYFRVFKNH